MIFKNKSNDIRIRDVVFEVVYLRENIGFSVNEKDLIFSLMKRYEISSECVEKSIDLAIKSGAIERLKNDGIRITRRDLNKKPSTTYSKFTRIGVTVDKSNATEESSSAETKPLRYIDR